MKTELILYKQQKALNPTFSIQPDYGWIYTGSNYVDWAKKTNAIQKIPGTARILYQDNILIPGVLYQVRFNVSAFTSGGIVFRNKSGGTAHETPLTDAIYDFTFIADGTQIRFEADASFDGTISKFSVNEYPYVFNIDLTEDVGIALNFELDDLFKLNQRKTKYSKTVKIKGTHNNNKAFNHIYKIDSESVYDPNKSSRIVVTNSGLTVFDGVLFINQITKTIQNSIEDIEYDVTMFGELVSIFDKFGNKTIKDLDFSRWDHSFSIQNILRSWSDPGSGLPSVFDNTTNTYLQNQQLGYADNGSSISIYSYQGINRVRIVFASTHSFSVNDYVLIYTDNNLLSGSQVIALIPDSTSIVLHMAYGNLTTTSFTNLYVQKRTWDSLGYYYPMQDNGSWQRICVNGDRDPVTGQIESGKIINGKLYTVLSLSVGDDFSNVAKDPLSPLTPLSVKVGVTFYASDGGPENTLASVNSWEYGTQLYVYDGKENGAKVYGKQLMPNRWHNSDFIPHIFIREAWNKMFSVIDYYYDCPLIDTDLFRRCIMPMDQSFNVRDYFINPFITPTPPPEPDQIVRMNEWLPQMKLSDFFISVLNLFNLIIIENKDQNNIIQLVSRSEFFNGNEVDLKLDSSQPLQIKLSNSYLPLSYQLKYKDSDDFFNKNYNTEFGNITNTNGIDNRVDRKYGDYYTITNNRLSKDEGKVEISFVPTVIAGNLVYKDSRYGGGSPTDPGNDKVFSVTYNADDLGNNASRKIYNRILLAGIRGTNYPWSITTLFPLDPGENFDVKDSTSGGRWYSYGQHLDNIFDGFPHYDLNFGTLIGQYFTQSYPQSDWESRTRYGQDWEKYLLDILDPNGKIVSGTFLYTIKDIANLDFRSVYKLGSYSLKLSKISDWNVNGDGLCKVAFTLKNL